MNHWTRNGRKPQKGFFPTIISGATDMFKRLGSAVGRVTSKAGKANNGGGFGRLGGGLIPGAMGGPKFLNIP